MPEALISRFTIHQPQPADYLESKWLGPLTIRRGGLLLCPGVTTANRYRADAFAAKGPPNRRAPRLGPRPFSISLVNSFGGNFVWQLHLYSRTNSKLNRAAALAEWRQLLSA